MATLADELREFIKLSGETPQTQEEYNLLADSYIKNRDRYKAQMQFRSYISQNYGDKLNSQEDYNRAANQYRYNMSRNSQGLQPLKFSSLEYNPYNYSRAQNEYNMNYYSKNKVLPTEYGEDFVQYENKIKRQSKLSKDKDPAWVWHVPTNDAEAAIKDEYIVKYLDADDAIEENEKLIAETEKKLNSKKVFQRGYDIIQKSNSSSKVQFVEDYDLNNDVEIAELEKILAEAKDRRQALRSEKDTVELQGFYATSIGSADYQKYSNAGNSLSASATELKNAVDSGDSYKALKLLRAEKRPLLMYMSADELGVYSYYIGKNDEKSATRFYDLLKENLKYRHGTQTAEKAKGNFIKNLEIAFNAGFDDFSSGIKGAVRAVTDPFTGNEEAEEITPHQYTADAALKNIDSDIGKLGFELARTGANQLPSVATSMLTGGTINGSYLMGLSAGGSSYNQARQEGKPYLEALTYGVLNGSSEVLMQKFLGGIKAYGGGAAYQMAANSKLGSRMLSKVDDVMKKVASTPKAQKYMRIIGGYLGDSAGEFTEEYLQEVLEPVFRNIAYGEENEVQAFNEEALHAGILGALSAAAFNAPSLAVSLSTKPNVNTNGVFEIDQAATADNAFAVFRRTDDGLEVVTDENGKIPVYDLDGARRQVHLKAKQGENLVVKNMGRKANTEAQKAVSAFLETKSEQVGAAIDKMKESNRGMSTGTTIQGTDSPYYRPHQAPLDDQSVLQSSSEINYEADPNVKVIQTQSGQTRIRRVADDQMEAIKGIDKKRVKQVNRVAKKLGLDVQWAWLIDGQDSNGNFVSNGAYDPSTKTIYLSMDGEASGASNPYMAILGHEVTHSLEGGAEYNKLLDYAVQRAKENGTYDQQISQLQAAYKGQDAAIHHELTSNLMMEMFGDERFIRRFVNENRGIAGKILNALDSILAKLKGDESFAEFEKIRNLFADAYRATNRNSDSNKVKYSKKLGGYFPNTHVSTEKVQEKYGIHDINREAEVKKQIKKFAKGKYLSTQGNINPIQNIDTGVEIEIWASGIDETFGNKKYYGAKSKEMKLAKLASMEVLPELIRYGEVRAESRMDSKNRNVEYDYLIAPLRVDDTQYWVTMDIKKYGEGVGNRFYVHNIVLNREQKDVPTKPSSVEVYTDPASSMEHPFVDQSISQDNAEVNTSIRSGQLDDTPDVQYSIAGRQAANKEIRDQKAKEKIMKSDRNMNSQKQDSLQNQTEGAEIAEANTPQPSPDSSNSGLHLPPVFPQ